MSPDEMTVAAICGALTLFLWGRLFWFAAATYAGARRPDGRTPLLLAPPFSIVVCFLILCTLAAHDVRDSPAYLFLYTLMAAAWLGIGSAIFSVFGISPRDDVLERSNRAASWANAGAMLGLVLCFAGGNVGDGPGWWVVVFSAGLSTLAFFVLWRILDLLTGATESITVDRDQGAGLRLAGALIGLGIILGRAVAGDWHSVKATLADFANAGWPAIALVVVAVLIERFLKPVPDRTPPPVPFDGIIPAVAYVACAAAYVGLIGVRP